jgi:hypothetical protein
MQFFIVTNIFNHKMNLESVKEEMCPHKLLCFKVLNIRPVLYSSREWNKNAEKQLGSLPANQSQGIGGGQSQGWKFF